MASSSSSSSTSNNNNDNTASVQVVVRVRPLNDREKKHGTLPVVSASTSDKTVTIIKGTGSRQVKSSYKFDNVFTSFSTQEDVFEATLQPIIKDVLLGYESTVFAYGQTGTGKTHTMEGNLRDVHEHGVIPRSAGAIFDALSKNPDYVSSSVHCSLLEIYNEELSDLLVDHGSNTNHNSKTASGNNKKQTKLAIMEGEHGPFCRGLSETKVESAEDLLGLMQTAHKQRQTGETDMNKESSRSHCIFTLRVEAKRQLIDGSILDVSGKLHCVDLAGSECAKSCGNAGKQQAARERERMNINRSLLTLGRVVKLLKEKSQKSGTNSSSSSSSVRIPYRDSKLTRILQESLGGRCKTCLIATISPSVTAIEESMSTLNYAQAANGIINKPVTTSLMNVGGIMDGTGSDNNKSLSEGGGSVEHWHEMECRLEYMQSQVEEAQQALARKHIQQQELVERAEQAELGQQLAERSLKKATHEISVLESKCDDISHKLEETEQSLHETKVVLDATKQTEAALTQEAKALIRVLKRTISEGDRMHRELLEKRTEEIHKKAATSAYQTQQSKLLDEILDQLVQIEASIQKHRSTIGQEKSREANTQLEHLREQSTIIEKMKQDCMHELEGLRQSTKSKLEPTLDEMVSSSKDKLNGLSTVLKDGDSKLLSSCQTLLDRLVENSHRITEMEKTYHSSSQHVLQTLVSRLEASKANLSTAVVEITTALQSAFEKRQNQRTGLKESIGSFQESCHESMDEIGSISKTHTTTLRETAQSIREAQPKRTSALESITNVDDAIDNHSKEYAQQLETQCAILTKQKEYLVAANEKQKRMNKMLVSKIMGRMQSLLEAEMDGMDDFQSETVETVLRFNGEMDDSKEALCISSDTFMSDLRMANYQTRLAVKADFDRQDILRDQIEGEASNFDSTLKVALENLKNPLDVFTKNSMVAIESSETGDHQETELLAECAKSKIETSTNHSLSDIREGTTKALSDLQETTIDGWKYVQEQVIDPVRNDVLEDIQANHRHVLAKVSGMIESMDSNMEERRKMVADAIETGLEHVSSAEATLNAGVDERFATSIREHQELLENSDWLESAMQSHETTVSDHCRIATGIVSTSNEKLETVANTVHRVLEAPAEIRDLVVPPFTEVLTATKDTETILREAGQNNEEDGCKENAIPQVPKTSSSPTMTMMPLQDRSGNETPNHNNTDSASSSSLLLKRVANSKTGIPSGGQKRSKRTKVSSTR